MIEVSNITVRFSGEALFSDVGFLIQGKEKVGLVGKNGAGKSTLLKLITGLAQPSEGRIIIPSDVSIGYLPQTMDYTDDTSIIEEAGKAFSHLIEIEKETENINHQLAVREDYESESYMGLIEKLNDLTDRYHILGGENREANIEKTLIGLGFNPSQFNQPTSTLSGGWRMRIELAKILLRNPDVLLLDEPTNHLDIESIQWLENFLATCNSIVVLISHDRKFLDTITTRTIEISNGKIFDYKVSYSMYVTQRKERREKQLAAYKNQQKLISDTEEFIERFRYKATKATQVQSRIKQLEKIDRIEIDEEDLSSVNIRFPEAPRAGTIVVETKTLSKSYGSKEVLRNIDLIIERGEKIAFVGKNGEGKTTLARIIDGELDFNAGECKIGHNVKIGYFAQNQDKILDSSKTVLETLDAIAVGDIRTKLRDILGAFLFSGEDVDKKVSVLSGGERSRLALAKLMLEPHNLLILDEPTNHLDMRSKDVLKKALNDFKGTVILVSHDRDFLSGLTDKVYEFKDKKIKQYLGDIEYFLGRKRIENLNELERNQVVQNNATENGAPSDNKLNYEQQKELDREIRKVEKNVQDNENLIAGLEKKIEEMDKHFQNPELQGQDLNDPDYFHQYNIMKKQLEEAMEKWETAQLELEELKNKRYGA